MERSNAIVSDEVKIRGWGKMMRDRADIFATLMEYIETVDDNIENLSKNFRNNKIEVASEEFLQLVDGLEWIEQVLSLTLGRKSSPLNEVYRNFVQAFEDRDYISIADLLEYELMPVLFEIHGKIEGLMERQMNEYQ